MTPPIVVKKTKTRQLRKHRRALSYPEEALVGVEPTVADLQSAALATWLQRQEKTSQIGSSPMILLDNLK
jgi:hypothetical protein